jgi:pyroglutamyl-peptidase
MATILLTGFGGFPGAPVNPSGDLARKLARIRRPAFANSKRVAHVFATSYAAVDRDLPALIARHQPDAIVMFGLASRTKHIRIEMQARNRRLVLFPDATGFRPPAQTIRVEGPARLRGRAPFSRLLAAARGHGVDAALSRNAGSYVCNYCYWRAIEGAPPQDGPITVFIHVPKVRGRARRSHSKIRAPLLSDLLKAGEAIMTAIVAGRRTPR